ncbi:hypothetical protein BJV74DRAFT_156499 [Russula compacta]|nr:hypothetical protein BJV74DRAFT_156499 [Russula compacta]
MTEGQSYNGPNDYRERFYNQVIQLADKFMEGIQQAKEPGFFKEPKELYPCVAKDWEGVQDAAKLLSQFVDPNNLLDRDKGLPRRRLSFLRPTKLTSSPIVLNRLDRWTLFSELRRVLRHISNRAIFSLFLSTAGRFNLFSPEIRSDPSARIQNSSLTLLDPITEISFDNLAYDAPEGQIMLNRVVGMDWMCHLDRQLFAAIYDAHEFRDNYPMELAKTKLLNTNNTAYLDPKNGPGSLACLSVRFALEFNMDGTAGDVARAQVERHMRLCLMATTERETFVTLAGSEPLLAEAAYELMKGTQSNPVHHLANHSDLNCVDRGRRGELVAALLIMGACDAARAEGQRWVSVDCFMKELLPQIKYQILKESLPTFYCSGQMEEFSMAFEGYGIWFNHVIKVEKKKMFSAKHLWKFITRGAPIMCLDNQQGVDIVIPICRTEQALSRHTVMAILVQVKNDEKFMLNIDKELLDNMDPIKLGLFPSKVDSKPVIRIVFALASTDVGANFPKQRGREHHYEDTFTAFDVWCAGLSKDTFKHIDDDLTSYQFLLERSLRPHNAFELLDDPKLDKETRRLRGSLRCRMAPFITDRDNAHHAIHLEKSTQKQPTNLAKHKTPPSPPTYPATRSGKKKQTGRAQATTE